MIPLETAHYSECNHWLHKIARVEEEGIMIVRFLWPIQPCTAGAPDSRCAKDTSTATDHDRA